jgi:large subunit ribosomal protein L29
MKADKVRDLDTNELTRQLAEIDEQMFRLQFQMSMGQMDGLKKVRAIRKDRARIHTILRERAESAPVAGEKK